MNPHARRKTSDYKIRLMEKQKMRFSYWVSETPIERKITLLS
jgi:hypothetical protein